ncbi:MAG: tetratricopeptide repeat protein [Rhodanobacter sp.]
MKALSIGLILMLVSLQTFAQTVQADLPSNDETACVSHDPNISIQGCTAVIQLGQATANMASVYINRGLSYARQGLYSQAIADQTKAIALSPDDALAYSNRGSFYGKTGLYDQDIADQTKAISLSPRSDMAFRNRGNAYVAKGMYDRAIADYTSVILLMPDSDVAYFSRGYAYSTKSLYDLAIGDYTKAISLNPSYALAYNNRALVYHLKGQNANGLSDAEKAVALAPSDGRIHPDKGTGLRTARSARQSDRRLSRGPEIGPRYEIVSGWAGSTSCSALALTKASMPNAPWY